MNEPGHFYRTGNTDLDWLDAKACRPEDQALFFPERGESGDAARQICMSCPVRVQCLEYSLQFPSDFGIVAGLSPVQRRRLRKIEKEKCAS